jgi:MscS family membrane protein
LGIFAYKLIPLFMQLATRNSKHYKETQKRSETVLRYLIVLVKVVLIIIALVAILSLWGVNVSGVLAGFGIGGLAVSLAAQDTLANLIGGMTIMTDRPFEIGDFVRIGTNEGTIEEIGFRSTKIRTLDMFLVVIPNSKVVNDSVVNISRLNKRRVRFELLLRRDTSPERVDDYVSKLRILIQQRDIAPGTDVLVVLQGVSGTAQIILVQYYISSTDYGEFLQEQEHVLLAADQLMAECGVESADPLGQQLQQNV